MKPSNCLDNCLVTAKSVSRACSLFIKLVSEMSALREFWKNNRIPSVKKLQNLWNQYIESSDDDESTQALLRCLQSISCNTSKNALHLETVFSNDMLIVLTQNLETMSTENKKLFAFVFKDITSLSTIDLPDGILDALMTVYGVSCEMATVCGSMIRSLIRSCSVTEETIQSLVGTLFTFLTSQDFAIMSDAWFTLRFLFAKRESVSISYLNAAYDDFFPRFMMLLDPSGDGYTVARNALNLLAYVMSFQGSHEYRIKFLSDATYLVTMLDLLNNPSENIRRLTFDVFKLFLAVPEKSKRVASVFERNKTALQEYFQDFLVDNGCPDFRNDVNYVVSQINSLFT